MDLTLYSWDLIFYNMDEQIKNKIEELFQSTPEGVGVMLGNKITNGEYTGEESIVFTVEKKKPLSDLTPEEILPSEVEIDGKVYKTDVFETGEIKAFACPSSILNACYSWQSIPPQNRQTIRPLKGGVSLTSQNLQGYVGTLGFLAVDTATGALVGITNNHVVIADAYYANFRSPTGIIQNESSDNAYQSGDIQPSPSSLKIGEVLRYVPISEPPTYNQVDGAMISISQSVMSDSESFKQLGLSGTSVMPFATTSEINALVGNTLGSSSGRSSGVKQGPLCGLTIQGINYVTGVSGYKQQGTSTVAYFNNCISFTRANPDCLYPIYPGDSGSALVATIGGVDKIIGLCFAGGNTIGIASRIDEVASQLGISAWNGTTPEFVDLTTKKLVTVAGLSNTKTITCSGDTLWQVGIINAVRIC
jgi:hypothetical protein